MPQLLLYYITDRSAFSGDEPSRRRALLDRIAEAARVGIDFIQLREKDLTGRDLETLAIAAAQIIGEASTSTRLLINSRTDIALATGAHGVHLRDGDLAPAEIRRIWSNSQPDTGPVIGVSCHSVRQVHAAASSQADFAVLAPVFEKKDAPGNVVAGLVQLRLACRAPIPVLALGGVTLANTRACIEAGAAGIAAIRLFQEGDLEAAVHQLRG